MMSRGDINVFGEQQLSPKLFYTNTRKLQIRTDELLFWRIEIYYCLTT